MEALDKNFYITTTLAYVNADLHIGHAAEFIRADILARHKKALGFEVFLNTGTDEHGQKILSAARERGVGTQVFVDEMFEKIKGQIEKMNVDYTNIIRTTDERHQKSAQEFWKRCEQNGDIYKKNYKIRYCVGCELEKTDSELVNGECPFHPGKKLEIREEENYFFRFSKYQQPLLELYEKNPEFVKPAFRLNEMKKFVEGGLQDFSISRLKEKMPWGVPVPNDDRHIMYVWFDALVNYISAIGWPDEPKQFEKWWPVFQVAGKDNLRQQAAMWQAMLMSAGLSPSRQIHIFGFINSGGQKMSKSLGNVINPSDIIAEYGTDALRYLVARHINMYEDSDITMEKIKEIYNANLANGLGNLVSRIMKMATDNLSEKVKVDPVKFKSLTGQENEKEILEHPDYLIYTDKLNNFHLNEVMDFIWQKISSMDEKISETEPYKLVKSADKDEQAKAKEIIRELVKELRQIAVYLIPFMPATAQKIQNCVRENKIPSAPLFLRK
ncbi:MAG: methionine--tRNA ligase [Candidatus Pacebacteria bacterium]|nr:methionine--tRNA ligase [Candidatus Paceibacterota bacterium]